MQVKGGKEVTLGPGQTFYESPEDVHTVSRNASTTKPAKFLVFFREAEGGSNCRAGKVIGRMSDGSAAGEANQIMNRMSEPYVGYA